MDSASFSPVTPENNNENSENVVPASQLVGVVPPPYVNQNSPFGSTRASDLVIPDVDYMKNLRESRLQSSTTED